MAGKKGDIAFYRRLPWKAGLIYKDEEECWRQAESHGRSLLTRLRDKMAVETVEEVAQGNRRKER